AAAAAGQRPLVQPGRHPTGLGGTRRRLPGPRRDVPLLGRPEPAAPDRAPDPPRHETAGLLVLGGRATAHRGRGGPSPGGVGCRRRTAGAAERRRTVLGFVAEPDGGRGRRPEYERGLAGRGGPARHAL